MRIRPHSPRALIALFFLVLLSCTAAAADWPRFRGPNGTGTADDKDVPVEWNAKEGILWKTPIPGRGNSSPVISRNRIFLQSASTDGKERMLYCLDASTGKILWSKDAPGAKATIHQKNTLASSTPAADGQRVYAVYWDGKDMSLFAYDYQGELLWKKDLGGLTSQHGAGCSPAVYDGKVFLNYDQDGAATLFAFEAKTGKKLWEAERKAFRACYSTPLILETKKGSFELIVSSTAGITSYDPEKGTENWNYVWSFSRMPLRTVASPIVSNGLVFANSGDGAGDRHLIAVQLGGKGDVTKTNLAWEERRSFPYVPCLLASGDNLFSVNDSGVAACHVAKTGEMVWTKRLEGAKQVTASPILVDGKIYAIDEDGQVYVFRAATEFKLLAKNSMGEPVLASPAVADDRLYIRGKEHLFCIGKPSAK
jgi:outer membrane protein assembly factor BamB